MMVTSIPGVELLEELGRGAHGAVFRGLREKRSYAIKVALTPRDPHAFVRFQREAIALARVKHPGLPLVLDVARAGTPYLVMELVHGETLAARLERGRLSEAEVIELGLELADVLDHVHAVGLVHRDVKPRNIIFEEGTGRVRLVDFGIAVRPAENGAAGFAEGTLPYAAPEQLSGMSVDGRADLYALGCVLFECLRGRPPEVGFNPRELDSGRTQAASPQARFRQVLSQESVTRTLREHLLEISPDLAELIGKLLAPIPQERFSSAREVFRALERIDGRVGVSTDAPLESIGELRALPLIGREAELNVLRHELADAARGGSRALFLEGPGGSGKSALLEAFAKDVRRSGHAAIQVRSIDHDPAPFGLIRRLLEACLERIDPARIAEEARGFESVLSLLSPSLARVLPEAPPMPESGGSHHLFLEGASQGLARVLALLGPGVVTVDDLHWVDAGSAAVLRRLLGALNTHGTLLVLALRPEAVDSPWVLSLKVRAQAERFGTLTLTPLTEAAIGSLAARYLGVDELPDDITSRLVALSPRTPLGVLEVLRTFLDERAILPHWGGWQLEPEQAEAMRLPDSTAGLLAARIARLGEGMPEVLDVLATAAALGADFDPALVAAAADRSEGEVATALGEARRAALVAGGPERFRVVHHAVRDALLSRRSEAALRRLYQRAAEALDRRLDSLERKREREHDAGGSSDEATLVPRVADLYFRGDWHAAPERSVEAVERAGRQAFEVFDNRQALDLLERAQTIRDAVGIQPTGPALQAHGEVLVRLGSLERGRDLLERALDLSKEPLVRARILELIAWTYEVGLDSEKAEAALRRAFAEVGEQFPDANLAAVTRSIGAWLRRAFGRQIPPLSAGNRPRQEVLASLYYRAHRLGSFTGNVPQALQASIRGVETAEPLGPSFALCRAYLVYAFVLTTLGQSRRARRYLQQADDAATVRRDPVAKTLVLQFHAVIASWEGQLGEALEVAARCLLEHGHWQELAEHCLLAHNQNILEAVRGRGYEELYWLEHILRQIERNPEAFGLWEMILLHAEALLVHLGREAEAGTILARLRDVTIKAPRTSSFYPWTFIGRARILAETESAGERLEALEAEFRQGGHDPRRVHLAVAEYYVHVAHAHVHACLRASEHQRSAELERLKRAAADLRAAARVPLLNAHSKAVDAYVAHFTGDAPRADRLFAEADALAHAEESPWVRYSVARGRAHAWKGKKHAEAIQAQARIAEAIARENGAVHRLRWIREEFALAENAVTFTAHAPYLGEAPSAGTRRLRRLETTRRAVRVAHTTEQAERQPAILDELLAGLGAAEAHLFHVAPSGRPLWSGGRDSSRQDAPPPPEHVERLAQSVVAQRLAAFSDDAVAGRSRVAVPLFDHGRVGGVLYLESPGCGAFQGEDGELVARLGSQLLLGELTAGETAPDGTTPESVGAELARAFGEDLERLLELEATSDTEALQRVVTFARHLKETRRLETHHPALVHLSDVVLKAGSRLRPLLGSGTELLVDVEPGLGHLELDGEHIQVLLLGLGLSAGLHIRGRGTVVLEATRASLDSLYAHRFPTAAPGAYALLTVAAVPELDAPTSNRAVGTDPFVRDVYGTAVRRSGGHLTLESNSELGQSVQLLFPRVTAVPRLESATAGTRATRGEMLPGNRETILLVEPDDRFRRNVGTALKGLGYRILLANDLDSASRLLHVHTGSVDLLVVEPGLYAGEPGGRGRALSAAGARLYPSRFSWHTLRAAGIACTKAEFLQKPFSLEELTERVRAALE